MKPEVTKTSTSKKHGNGTPGLYENFKAEKLRQCVRRMMLDHIDYCKMGNSDKVLLLEIVYDYVCRILDSAKDYSDTENARLIMEIDRIIS